MAGRRQPTAARPGRKALLGCATVAAVTGSLLLGVAPSNAAEVSPAPGNGIWTVDGHGNGHGHGLSQYGARGAAIAGLSYDKILAFYYPGTTLATGSAVSIRVAISAAGADPTVLAEPGLTVTGVSGALPTSGITQWRAVPITGGFQLQRHLSTGWNAYKNLPASRLDFRSSDGNVALVRSSGTRNYRGAISAVHTGSTAIAVNTLGLDQYLLGVVPSEMPASWQAAAVQAQAVAARSYARYYVNHPRDTNYDICDTTACQVYGGLSAEQASSNAAVSATANKVLTYAGATIFAEFSASNGGITSAGNQPYFVTKIDPYDNTASGDPYLNWTTTATVADVAAYYGLATVSQLQIAGRAPGAGQWGGLVTTAIVNGSYPGGATAAISTTGAALASAMGLSYSYFHIRPVLPIGHLDAASMTALHVMTVRGWALDLADGSKSSTVRVQLDGATTQTVTANLPRPDVQAAYHLASAAHGYQIAVTVPGGSHRVCVSALSLTGQDLRLLGCQNAVVSEQPVGHLDSITTDGLGHFRLHGWTFDQDRDGGPGRVAGYVDQYGLSTNTTLSRVDVQHAYRISNSVVGFDVPLWVPAGRHTVCAYALNITGTPGSNQLLQCKVVVR